MLSLHRSSGTLLYPILGTGFFGSANGSYVPQYQGYDGAGNVTALLHAVTRVDYVALLALTVLWASVRAPEFGTRAPLLGLAGASLVMAPVVELAGGHPRFRFSFVFASLTLLLLDLGRSIVGRRGPSRVSVPWLMVTAGAIGLTVVAARIPDTRFWYRTMIEDVWNGVRGRDPGVLHGLEKYRHLQEAIDRGETLLARVERPYLFNLGRNRVWIVDNPGGASLPPGMPYRQGAEVLARYLGGKSIRYVAYSYATQAGYPARLARERLGSGHVWSRTQAAHVLDFQTNLAELGWTRRRVYDDGRMFVLDLLTPDETGRR
jgi:hypothetical protein